MVPAVELGCDLVPLTSGCSLALGWASALVWFGWRPRLAGFGCDSPLAGFDSGRPLLDVGADSGLAALGSGCLPGGSCGLGRLSLDATVVSGETATLETALALGFAVGVRLDPWGGRGCWSQPRSAPNWPSERRSRRTYSLAGVWLRQLRFECSRASRPRPQSLSRLDLEPTSVGWTRRHRGSTAEHWSATAVTSPSRWP